MLVNWMTRMCITVSYYTTTPYYTTLKKAATSEDSIGGFKERIKAISAKNQQIIDLSTSHEKKAEETYALLTNIVFNLDKKRAFFYDKIPEVRVCM